MKRNKNIDALKCFAICLVVIGHLMQLVFAKSSFDNNFVFKIIYSFHMPLFMFISGYLVYKSKNKDFKWLIKKFTYLVIPFFVWMIVDYIVYSQYKDYNILVKIIETLVNPDKGLWFLLILFYSYLMIYISSNIVDKTNLKNILGIVLLLIIEIIPINKFGIGLFKFEFIFFLIGYFYNLVEKQIKSKKNYMIVGILSLVLFLILVSFWQRIGMPTFYNNLIAMGISATLCNVIVLIYKFLLPLLGIISFFFIFQIINEKYIPSVVCLIGQSTMEIYILHVYIIHLFNNFNYANNWFMFPIEFIMCLAIPILIFKLISKNKYIKKVLFGR